MSFCPLLSKESKLVNCRKDCSFYCENNQCAIKNLGNTDSKVSIDTLHKDIDTLSDQVYNLYQSIDNYLMKL